MKTAYLKGKERCTSIRVILVLGILFSISYANAVITEATQISDPINSIVCILWVALRDIAGALAALIFVFAGIQYLASQDDPSKRKQARDTMIHCLIGLIIIVVADSIVDTVGQAITTGGGYQSCRQLI